MSYGFFDKIKQSLTRTKEQFVERFDEAVSRADRPRARARPIDVDTVEALEEALISADVGVAATDADRRRRAQQRGAASRCASWCKREILDILAAPTPAPNGQRRTS